MAENSKSFFQRLAGITQAFTKQKTTSQLDKLDRLIDEMVRKNNLVVSRVQERINRLDLENFPATASAPKYRWERLIKDLDILSDRLQHLKQCLHRRQVRKALYMFTFDLWPLALKVSCRYQVETGAQGDWIEDTTALYSLCEKYAEAVENAGDVDKSDESAIAQTRREITPRIIVINRPEDEDNKYDINNDKRAS